MAQSAPYEVNIAASDDETFVFTVEFTNSDGTAFAFASYEIEYIVGHVTLTQGNGVTVAAPAVTFKAAEGTLCPGRYEHACRLRTIASGETSPVFDGTVTIDEGPF